MRVEVAGFNNKRDYFKLWNINEDKSWVTLINPKGAFTAFPNESVIAYRDDNKRNQANRNSILTKKLGTKLKGKRRRRR